MWFNIEKVIQAFGLKGKQFRQELQTRIIFNLTLTENHFFYTYHCYSSKHCPLHFRIFKSKMISFTARKMKVRVGVTMGWGFGLKVQREREKIRGKGREGVLFTVALHKCLK